MQTKDFDRFMAERAGDRMTVRILGRDCRVPRELPWHYMLRVERMIRTGDPIPGEENMAMLRRMLLPEDYEYVTSHPDFRASWFWEIIAFAWLRADEGPSARDGGFQCEDDVRVERTREDRPKKTRSARSSCGRTSRLTSRGSTASTC